MVEIIIISYNQPELARRCVQSVIDYTDLPYHLTLYDNAKSKENLGHLWNRLIRRSEAEYICLLNDDTMVEREWLKKLREVFDKEVNVGAVGPVTNASSNPQSSYYPSKERDIIDFCYLHNNWCLSGFCLIFKKDLFEKLGGFPEDFGFYGQETAFLDKMRKTGWRQMLRKDVFIWHYGSASAKKAESLGQFDKEVEKKKSRERIERLRNENLL